MNLETRKAIYKKLEEKRGNPLIVYAISSRPGVNGQLAGDVVNEMIEQINLIPDGTQEIDLFIKSTGGDGLAAWRIISILRAKATKINILIPDEALSAATILALGANKIVMGKYGCLGPIDPQITITKNDGSVENFAYEDLASFLNFSKNEVGLTEQEHIEKIFSKVCDQVNPMSLGFANRASSLAVEMGQKLLLTHMPESENIKAKEIATKLNKNFFSHGHVLFRDEAEKIGLKIEKPDDETESLMWQIRESFKEEMQIDNPFVPLSEYLNDPSGQIMLTNPPVISVPTNIDPNLVNQVIIGKLQQQLSTNGPDVVREIKVAALESTRRSAEFYIKLKIIVFRNIDLNFKVNVVNINQGWRQI